MRRAILCAVLLGTAVSARAGDWPQWRGPLYNGSAEETSLPQSWSPTENIAWSTALPGPSGATPVVWGERVFVSSTQKGSKDLLALCLSVKDGRVLWQKKAAVSGPAVPGNTMASPSPVTDGKRVIFLYGTGDLAAFDADGNPLWSRALGEEFGRFSVKYGYSSSPLLYEGRLYVQVLRNERPYSWSGAGRWPTDSFLLALDAATGRDLWKRERKTDAVVESKDAYSTPMLSTSGGKAQILVSGGDYLTAHDPITGDELWRIGYNPDRHNTWRLIPSPVPGEGMAYAVAARGGQSPLFAVPLGRTGTLAWADKAWSWNAFTPDVCVPLLYRDRLYVLGDGRRCLTCLDAKTGREIWQGELERDGVYRASPTGADGKIYCISEAGVVTVVAAGDKFEVLSRIPMGEGPTQSSIVAAAGHLFIRTPQKLYCVGK